MSSPETVSTEVTIGTSPIGSVQRVPERNIHPLPVETDEHALVLKDNITQMNLGIALVFGSDAPGSNGLQEPTISQESIHQSPTTIEPTPKINTKLARAFEGIVSMLMNEAFQDGKLPSVSQLAIQLRCRSDYINEALDALFQRGIAVPINGRWYRAGSPAEKEALTSSHQPTHTKIPILVFGEEPPRDIAVLKRVFGIKTSYQQLDLNLPANKKRSRYKQPPLPHKPTKISTATRGIEYQIRDLPPNDTIEPAKYYARLWDCSGETARRAIVILAQQGWLTSNGTKGYKRTDKMPILTLEHLASHLGTLTGRPVTLEEALNALIKTKNERSISPELEGLLPNEEFDDN